eukprot:12907361-Prorocentrum_lima.AAC.1
MPGHAWQLRRVSNVLLRAPRTSLHCLIKTEPCRFIWTVQSLPARTSVASPLHSDISSLASA